MSMESFISTHISLNQVDDISRVNIIVVVVNIILKNQFKSSIRLKN